MGNGSAFISRRGFLKGSAAASALAAMGGATGILAGCSREEAPVSSESLPDTLTIYVGSEPEDGFDPLTGWGYNGSYILFQSRLLKFDTDMQLNPDLATGWSVSSDGLEYTFTLRENARFSDGSDLTAGDVAFSYLTARDNGASTIDLSKVAEVSVEDDYTVVFRLSEPYSSFPQVTAKLGIVPERLYNEQTYRSDPIGSGPFKLDQWDAGQQIIISPNEFYYGTISPFRRITLLFLDGETSLAHAQSGELDVAMVQPEYATSSVNGMTLRTFDTMDTRGFNLPTAAESQKDGKTVGNNVTCDKAIRKALNIGVDRSAIVEGALNGIGTPTTALITGVPWANSACSYKDGRLDEAKKLLDDAGWKEGSDGIREKDGVRAEFSITGRTDDMQRYNIAEAFAQQAQKLGIKINATSALWSDCKAQSENVPTCWGTGDWDPSGDLVGYYSSTGPYNHAQYANSAVDQHIHSALATTDDAVALSEWQKVQWDGTAGPEGEDGDMPFIWLVSIDHTYFVRNGLYLGEQPVHPHGHGWPIVGNLEEWMWEEQRLEEEEAESGSSSDDAGEEK